MPNTSFVNEYPCFKSGEIFVIFRMAAPAANPIAEPALFVNS